MSRLNDPDLRRSQIIAGALQVFSTKGFAEATNKDIATAAGNLSPALIYHYFESKADLLRAVVSRYVPPYQFVDQQADFMALPPEEAFSKFGEAFVRFFRSAETRALLRMMIGEAIRQPEFAATLSEVGPLRILDLLVRYISAQMDAGRLRHDNPEIAARCFIGPMMEFLIFDLVFDRRPEGVEPEQMAKASIDMFLRSYLP